MVNLPNVPSGSVVISGKHPTNEPPAYTNSQIFKIESDVVPRRMRFVFALTETKLTKFLVLPLK